MYYLVNKGADILITYKETDDLEVKKILAYMHIEYKLHKDINLKK